MQYPWRDYKSYLEDRYGERVYRIGLDGGFSCPNRSAQRTGGCIYCDAKGSSAIYQRENESGYTRKSKFIADIDAQLLSPAQKNLEQRLASVTHQIERGKRFIDERYPHSAKSIYFQAFTSTYDAPDTLRALYDHALSTGIYKELIISTRPDCIDEAVVELLSTYQSKVDAVWVELGLQSGNDATLAWIGRGHLVRDYLVACHRLKMAGVKVSAHVILGFPQEADAEILTTAHTICESHPEAIKIHNLQVVAGTRLYDLYRQGKVRVASFSDHIHNTILLLRHIPSDIVIQRFLSETPAHRLAAPRDFGDKNSFIIALSKEMQRLQVTQGDAL